MVSELGNFALKSNSRDTARVQFFFFFVLQGDLVGLTGWVRRPPITKVRNNGDAVLLVDLEDELGDSVRIICLNAVRDRYQNFCVCVTSLEMSACPHSQKEGLAPFPVPPHPPSTPPPPGPHLCSLQQGAQAVRAISLEGGLKPVQAA